MKTIVVWIVRWIYATIIAKLAKALIALLEKISKGLSGWKGKIVRALLWLLKIIFGDGRKPPKKPGKKRRWPWRRR